MQLVIYTKSILIEKQIVKCLNDEIRVIQQLLEKGQVLSEKYRFLLFEDKTEMELVWKWQHRRGNKYCFVISNN